MKKILNTLLQWTWCLPQNILGLFVFLYTKLRKAKTEPYNGALVTKWDYCGGVSLGQFIFVWKGASESTIKHEYGHYIDSNCLGPLYLIVIGLPSLIWCEFFKKYRTTHKKSYYDFYTEYRAERLGETKRND